LAGIIMSCVEPTLLESEMAAIEFTMMFAA
jgi:hypothetical protein